MLPNFHTNKTDLSAELKRAQELLTQKRAIEIDSAEWDRFTDYDSAESKEIRALNDALENFELEHIFQHGVGIIDNQTYKDLRKILLKEKL